MPRAWGVAQGLGGIAEGLGVTECRRPSTSLVVRWEETGSKGHLAFRKGSLVILANRVFTG